MKDFFRSKWLFVLIGYFLSTFVPPVRDFLYVIGDYVLNTIPFNNRGLDLGIMILFQIVFPLVLSYCVGLLWFSRGSNRKSNFS